MSRSDRFPKMVLWDMRKCRSWFTVKKAANRQRIRGTGRGMNIIERKPVRKEIIRKVFVMMRALSPVKVSASGNDI